MENMKVPLEGFLNLELDCFYEYEPEVQGDDINPPEQAIVELACVYLGDGQLKLDLHLTTKQWQEIEQYIYEQHEMEL
jgi:hypothetical protein